MGHLPLQKLRKKYSNIPPLPHHYTEFAHGKKDRRTKHGKKSRV